MFFVFRIENPSNAPPVCGRKFNHSRIDPECNSPGRHDLLALCHNDILHHRDGPRPIVENQPTSGDGFLAVGIANRANRTNDGLENSPSSLEIRLQPVRRRGWNLPLARTRTLPIHTASLSFWNSAAVSGDVDWRSLLSAASCAYEGAAASRIEALDRYR